MKSKVLISIDSFHDGGAEMFAIRLANAMSSDHEVHFLEFNTYVGKVKAQKKLLSPDVKLFVPDNHFLLSKLVRFRYWVNPKENLEIDKLLDYFRSILLKRYLNKHDIRVVNSHAILQNDTLIAIKRKVNKLRLVLTLHGHYEYHQANHPDTFNGYITRHAGGFDYVVHTTEQQKQNFLNHGLDAAKAKLIFYGFDPKVNATPEMDKEGNFNIILHSRAIQEKGWLEAIEAVIILRNQGYQISLTLIGIGQLLGELWEKHHEPFLEILGFKDDVLPYVKRADIGLLPSYFSGESLPNSVIECLYFSKPVISTSIGAIPMMLQTEEGVAGDIIPTEKGKPILVAELVSIIKRYLDDSTYLANKIKLAKLAYKKFEMKECIKSYERVFFK